MPEIGIAAATIASAGAEARHQMIDDVEAQAQIVMALKLTFTKSRTIWVAMPHHRPYHLVP